jgi:hypothetical protein
MVIYADDFAPTGFTAADLKKGGKAYDQWPDIEKKLVEIAKKKISIASHWNRVNPSMTDGNPANERIIRN